MSISNYQANGQLATPLTRRAIVRAGGVGLVAVSVGARPAVAAVHDDDDYGTPEPGSAGKVTIYSGRNEELIGPLFAACAATTGITPSIRYGETAELAATILEEGDNSPADLYVAQDAGALGALARENRFQELPEELLALVDARFRSPDGTWIGITGRARVAIYNTDTLSATDLPPSVLDFAGSEWRGKLGWAPTNGSFQAFVTALRLIEGDDAARDWLNAMLANEPVTFDGNGAIVRAVADGEIVAGLVNHYYLYEIQAEEGSDLPIANHFFAAGDVGSLVNVAGAGVLEGAANATQALATIECLLQPDAQRTFAETTFEYPLINDVPAAAELPPLADIESPELDLSDLSDLQGTLSLLAEVGVL
ncbi:MAG: iron ABC transporter substrate-binding protein [Chloroflexota bacterium]|nr:iron ABC transporter substrate-binding protein [Chloroflexota bacterium]